MVLVGLAAGEVVGELAGELAGEVAVVVCELAVDMTKATRNRITQENWRLEQDLDIFTLGFQSKFGGAF